MRLHNSPRELLEFFNHSTIWPDIQATLQDWINGLHELLETASTWEEVKGFQGNIEALRRIQVELPNMAALLSENQFTDE